MTISSAMMSHNPHPDFVDFVDQYDEWQDAWDDCVRGDWMLWLLGMETEFPIMVQHMNPRGDLSTDDEGNPVDNLPEVDLLAAAVDCACTVEDLWPDDVILIPGIGSVSGIDVTKIPDYEYAIAGMLGLVKTSLTEFVSWVKRGGGPTTIAEFTAHYDSSGMAVDISVDEPGVNVGCRTIVECGGGVTTDVTEYSQANFGITAEMTIKDGAVKKVKVISQQIPTNDPNDDNNYQFARMMLTSDISAYTIVTSCDYASADLYMMMRYMEDRLKNAHSRVRAGMTSEQDAYNAGVFATRAMYYAGFVARAQHVNFCGAAAYDAARAKAYDARSEFTDDVQAKIAGYNEQLAQYRATPNADTIKAYTDAVKAHKAAVKIADNAYKEALAEALAECADIVRDYYPDSPL